jgi:ankyrin repeat protein
LHLAATDKKLAICELLASQEGVDARVTANNNSTILHYLVRHIYAQSELQTVFNIMTLLLNRGLDINAQNEFGETALQQACLRGKQIPSSTSSYHSSFISL